MQHFKARLLSKKLWNPLLYPFNRVRLSKTGVAICSLSLGLYLASMQSMSGILFLFLGILFGIFIINFFAARKSVLYAEITPPDKLFTSEGNSITDSWRISNNSQKDIGRIEVHSPWGKLLHIPILQGREVHHQCSDLPFSHRGIYPIATLKITSTFPFGLIRYQKYHSCDKEVVVHPAVYPCSPPVAAGFEPMLGGRFLGKYTARSGDHFHGVRPMQPQDPVRLIHWSCSSKGMGLMVKEFDEEVSGRISFIFGGDEGKQENEHLFDAGIRAAGSLIIASLDIGYQIEFIFLSSQTVKTISPFTDGNVVLDMLARLQPGKGTVSSANITQAITKISRNAGLCFLLTSMTPEAMHTINEHVQDRRKISLYLPLLLRSSPINFSGTSLHYYSGHSIR